MLYFKESDLLIPIRDQRMVSRRRQPLICPIVCCVRLMVRLQLGILDMVPELRVPSPLLNVRTAIVSLVPMVTGPSRVSRRRGRC